MNIAINIHSLVHQPGRSLENARTGDPASPEGFLSVAKKIFSVFAAAPAADAEQPSLAHFKKIKEPGKPDKKRTEEDALRDIEKLLRRVEKNKKTGRHA